jgi:SAM-dependent methyltransferase
MGEARGFRHRRRQPEIMDQPGLDPAAHRAALAGLGRVNAVSGCVGILWPPIRDLARAAAPRPLRVLDLASGGGDVALGLWDRARRAGLALYVEGRDLSPVAVAYAREQADRRQAPVRFHVADVLADALPDDFDVTQTSLFLHHLSDDQAVELLAKMAAAARRLVLVNDLVRSRVAHRVAWVGCRLLTRSPVVHVDGPLSVRAAFTTAEARELARRAGLAGATVRWRWPWRFLLAWRRP